MSYEATLPVNICACWSLKKANFPKCALYPPPLDRTLSFLNNSLKEGAKALPYKFSLVESATKSKDHEE